MLACSRSNRVKMRLLYALPLVLLIYSIKVSFCVDSFPIDRIIKRQSDKEFSNETEPCDNEKGFRCTLSPKQIQEVMAGSRKTVDYIVKTQRVLEKEKTTAKPKAQPKKFYYDTGGYMNEPIGPIEQNHPSDVESLQKSRRSTNATIPVHYSPVTLDHSWGILHRLLFVSTCFSLGTTMNGFFVASFFVDRSLSSAGNVFLACLGLSDLISTAGVMPTVAVVLLSGQWDNVGVCSNILFGSETSSYSYSMLLFLTALETYIKLHCSRLHQWFGSVSVGVIAVSVYILSTILAGFGVFMHLDFDYCERKHSGNEIWRITTGTMFHFIPGILTMIILVSNVYGIKSRARTQPNYKRSHMYELDKSLTKLNILAFVLYAAAWMPYTYITYFNQHVSDQTFYYSAWLGVFRSILTSIFYCFVNKNFKDSFENLFNYCCCKSSLNSNINSRHRRAIEGRPTIGEVRIHLMQPAIAASPQRSTSSARELQEL